MSHPPKVVEDRRPIVGLTLRRFGTITTWEEEWGIKEIVSYYEPGQAVWFAVYDTEGKLTARYNLADVSEVLYEP